MTFFMTKSGQTKPIRKCPPMLAAGVPSAYLCHADLNPAVDRTWTPAVFCGDETSMRANARPLVVDAALNQDVDGDDWLDDIETEGAPLSDDFNDYYGGEDDWPSHDAELIRRNF